MSTWRQKAIETAPELRKEFESPDLSPYTVFFELLPLLKKAHEDSDVLKVQRIYNYAAWCFRQKDEKLWNAAGVGFYEHLGDNEVVFSHFTDWISRKIYLDIRDLLWLRLEDGKMEKLDSFYKINKSS